MKVLITGVNGYLGQALVRQCRLNQEHALMGVSRICAAPQVVNGMTSILLDLNQPYADASLPPGLSVDVVVHLAALVHNASGLTQGALLQQNVAMTRCAWAIAQKTGAKKFIYSSSMTVYDSREGYVRGQEDDLLAPDGEYAQSKLECENFLRQEVSHAAGVRLVILRFPGLFGGGRPRGLIRILADGIRARQSLSLDLKGLGNWDFMHVDDAASVLMQAIDRGDIPDTVFNVGYDDRRTNLDHLIAVFRGCFVSQCEVLVNSREDYRPFSLNTEKLRSWLGAGASGSLDKALERFMCEIETPCRS